jgi:hypothetical protein
LNVFLRFEYNDGQFSESAKFDVTDGSPRQIDHAAVLSLNAADPVQVDDLGHKPVLSTNDTLVASLSNAVLFSYSVRSDTEGQETEGR